MKPKTLLILLIISVGINLGVGGAYVFYSVKKHNHKNAWKNWEKRIDKTWEGVQDTLDIDSALVEQIRAELKAGSEETRKYWGKLKENRDSILSVLSEPELDTARLNQFLLREEQMQTEIGFMLYMDVYRTKQMLPAEKQERYLEMFEPAINFSGKPWYISDKRPKFGEQKKD